MALDEKRKEVVYQSNESIRMNTDLTLPQWQVLFIAEAQLFPHLSEDGVGDDSFLETTIPAADVYSYFSKYGGSDRHDLYKTVKTACAQMMSLTFEERIHPDDLGDNEKEGFIYINVFERISFSRAQGLKFLFTKSMIPHLLRFWRGYAKIPVKLPFVVSSNYAVKLYMLLMTKSFHEKWHNGKFWLEVEMSDLRHALGVPKDSYTGRINNFYKYVLDRPIKEIEDNLNCRIKRIPLKDGRKVVGMRFEVVDLEWNAIDVSERDDEPPKLNDRQTEAPSQEKAKPVAPNETKQGQEEQEDPAAAYLAYVTRPREQNGLWGVEGRTAKKFIASLGWQRCKLISDSMLPSLHAGKLISEAAALVGAWKKNQLYEIHGVPVVNVDEPSRKKSQTEKKPFADIDFGGI